MIRDWGHALEVQGRRYEVKKRGISKAIRRWMKRKDISKTSTHYQKLRSIANFAGCREEPQHRAIVMATGNLRDEPKDVLYKMFGGNLLTNKMR